MVILFEITNVKLENLIIVGPRSSGQAFTLYCQPSGRGHFSLHHLNALVKKPVKSVKTKNKTIAF